MCTGPLPPVSIYERGRGTFKTEGNTVLQADYENGDRLFGHCVRGCRFHFTQKMKTFSGLFRSSEGVNRFFKLVKIMFDTESLAIFDESEKKLESLFETDTTTARDCDTLRRYYSYTTTNYYYVVAVGLLLVYYSIMIFFV